MEQRQFGPAREIDRVTRPVEIDRPVDGGAEIEPRRRGAVDQQVVPARGRLRRLVAEPEIGPGDVAGQERDRAVRKHAAVVAPYHAIAVHQRGDPVPTVEELLMLPWTTVAELPRSDWVMSELLRLPFCVLAAR